MNAERKISVATAEDAPPREKKGLRRVLMVVVPLAML